jgi:hypothetical protein
VDEFLASDPSEEEETPKKKPSKNAAADPYESTYPIEDVLKEELLKGKSPFPQLGSAIQATESSSITAHIKVT